MTSEQISEDHYEGMTYEQAWADYHERHPEVLSNWGEQNGRWPNDHIPADILAVNASDNDT